MGATSQHHSKYINREEVESMQQSSKMVLGGGKRGFQSKERGTRKTDIEKNCGRIGKNGSKESKRDGREEGKWKDAVNEANEDFDGGVKHMWVGTKGY